MTYRIMVRSFEGYWLFGAHADRTSYWTRREVWSTWSDGNSYADALCEAFLLRLGGVKTAMIPEDEYDRFCNFHHIR